jgi:RHS repeat-associated protein
VEKIDNPFRYCGEYLDEETGNYYLRARYYDPSIQRFTQEDSYAIAFGVAWQDHLYSYAANNPVRYIDPSGHLTEGQILQKGSKGQDVKLLQRRLMSLGLLTIPKDKDGNYIGYGTFGPRTLAAVNKYKKDHGLWNFDQYAGKVGETTWRHLGLPVNSSTITDDHATNRKGGSKPVKENDSITATTPNIAPVPQQPKNIKSIEETMNEVDLSHIPSDIWKGMKSEGIKPYKQTAGAIFLGLALKAAVWEAATAPTRVDVTMGGANTVADILGPPLSTTLPGAFYYISNELLDIEGILRDAFSSE